MCDGILTQPRWFSSSEAALPRDNKTIRKSMAETVARNPLFAALSGEPRYQGIMEKLLFNLEEGNRNA